MDIPHYAVLTGDIVGSRKLSTHELASLFEGVRGVWRCFAEHHGDAVIGELDVFRGDGWQVALTQPALCLRAAVFLRAAFRAHSKKMDVDSRIGVGVGSVDRIVQGRLSESNGLAFQRSGSALESLPAKGLRWAFDGGPGFAARSLGSMSFPLMDLLIQRWSPSSSIAVVGTLLGMTQDEIAQHPLSRKSDGEAPTRQAIHDALKRIAWASHWEPVLRNADELWGHFTPK